MSDRIKLAEAMGWRWRETLDGPKRVEMNYWQEPSGAIHSSFDPFTDANDDYAVLEWMRDGGPDRTVPFFAAMKVHKDAPALFAFDYKIGDYARAALKVAEKLLEDAEL